MKKKFLSFIAIIALVLGLSALFIACGEDNVEYSVTVLSPDEEPISDVTVSWMSGSNEKGKAQTDEDGVAKATLPVGVYSIVLSGNKVKGYNVKGYENGTTPTTAGVRDITLDLIVKRVTYSVTVKDKNGNAAQNVTVSWVGTNGNASGTTDASGKASCELDYGDYTVVLGNLPEDNVYDGGKTVSGANPSATFTLRAPQGDMKDYCVTVKSEGGLLFKKKLVQVFRNKDVIASGETNARGEFAFKAEAGDCTVYPYEIPDGYTYEPVTLTADNPEGNLVLKSEIIDGALADGKQYVIGDIFHDYTFTTTYELTQYEYQRDPSTGKVLRDEDGNALVKKDGSGNDVTIASGIWSKSVADILKEKEVLILNNWGTNCSWCVKEMPDMQRIYEEYGDKVEIVAVSNYLPADSDAAITAFAQENGLTFPLMRDTNGFTAKFGITGWPTTVVIDRYGAFARIECGAITNLDAWERLILKYIGDDYVQPFEPGVPNDPVNSEISKPDITVPADHYTTLGTAINNAQLPEGASVEWSTGETQYEFAWPFLVKQPGEIGEDDVASDLPYMYASNTGKPNSMAVICAKVNAPAGKVLTLDYYADSEKDYDSFFIIWDGRIIHEISGKTSGWTTCYVFVELTDGEHDLMMAYRKDGSNNEGKDNVYIRNVRFTEIGQINESTDMLRSAAYGEITGDRFAHYASVSLDQNDVNGAGSQYYHVNIDSLENKEYAGTDKSPLLLVNLTGVTPWSNPYSINDLVWARKEEGSDEYLYHFNFNINGVERDYRKDFVRYLSAANASYVAGCVPVDEFLQKLLVAFMQEVCEANGIEWHQDKWLEACYFYSHYGTGDPVGNPIMGVMQETAISVGAGRHTADITRNMAPFPIAIYSFTPEKSAVYKIESHIEGNKSASQIWIYRDSESIDEPLVYDGDLRIHRDGKNEQNFVVYYYMRANEKYYLSLAFLMAGSGKYDFSITDTGMQEYTELVPASDDIFEMILDSEGNWNGNVQLQGAVEYEKKDDGYYYATNGSPIYIDVSHVVSNVSPVYSIEQLLDMKIPYPIAGDVPENFEPYPIFDFRYCIIHWKENDVNYFETNYDLTPLNPEIYKDYTEILRTIINNAKTAQGGSFDGLIHVNQEIVDIVNLFIQLRAYQVNLIEQNGQNTVALEALSENEWLRFCWYNVTHGSETESLPVPTAENGQN